MLFGKEFIRDTMYSYVKIYSILIDRHLRFEEYITRCIQKAYCNLKIVYANRYCLSRDLKILLCDILVLSCINYYDSLYDSCIREYVKSRIQKV